MRGLFSHAHGRVVTLRVPARGRTRGDREEGAVMLVVMLILMVGTAAAAMSVQSTQYELQAAGHERQALQARYLAESTMLTTAAWFDKVFDPVTGGGFTRFYGDCTSRAAPEMWRYGQPEVDTSTQPACRLSWLAMKQIAIATRSAYEVDPSSKAVPVTQSPPTMTPDYLGSFGPRQAYQPEANANEGNVPDFVVDLVCRQEGFSPGSVVAGGTRSTRTRRYYCVVTARARSELPGVTQTRNWSLPGSVTYAQNPFSTYHEMRMTLLTPEEVY